MEDNGKTREKIWGIVVSLSPRFRLTSSQAFRYSAVPETTFCQPFCIIKTYTVPPIAFCGADLADKYCAPEYFSMLLARLY